MSEKTKKRLRYILGITAILSILSIGAIFAFDRSFDVANATPRGELNAPPSEIMVRFSKPIIELGGLSKHSGLKVDKFLKISPPLKGRLNFKGTDALSFIIDKKSLRPNTKYTVTVKSTIKSVKGTPLGHSYRFSFINDRFRIIGSNLSRYARHETLKPYILLYFTQPIDRDSARRYIKVWQNSTTIPYTLHQLDPRKTRRRYLSSRFVPWRTYYHYMYKRNVPKYIYQLKFPKLKKHSRYIITISSRLRSTKGTLSLHKSATLKFKTYGPLLLKKPELHKEHKPVRPNSYFYIKFSNGVKTENKQLKKMIKILDKNGNVVPGSYISHYRNSSSIYCYFKLKARKEYTLLVKKGIKDIFGQTLNNDIRHNFETGDYSPSIKIPYPYSAIIENYGKIDSIPISFINLNKLNIDVKSFHSPRVFANNNPSKRKVFTLKESIQRRNIRFLKKINLTRFLNRKSGILKIKVNAEKNTTGYYKNYTANFLLQFTRMSITLKYSPKNIFIYVTDLKTTKPIPYATIEIYKKTRYGKKRIYWGRTNRKGIAIISEKKRVFKKLYQKYSYRKTLTIFARKGRDFCMLDNSYRNKVSIYNTGVGYPGTTMQKFYASVFTPKGIYKKKETVVIKGYVRQNRGGRLYSATGKRYRVYCKTPSGKIVINKVVSVSRYGSFAIKYKLPTDPELGHYPIVLYEANKKSTQSYSSPTIYGSFMVEAYRPRDFEVDVKAGTPGKTAFNGESIPFTVRGRYMYGGFMANTKVKYRIEAHAYSFYPGKRFLRKFQFSSNNWLASPKDKKNPYKTPQKNDPL